MIFIQRRSVGGHIPVSFSGLPGSDVDPKTSHPGVFCGIPQFQTDAGTILLDHDRFLSHSS
jgi:hypothetical protein